MAEAPSHEKACPAMIEEGCFIGVCQRRFLVKISVRGLKVSSSYSLGELLISLNLRASTSESLKDLM